MVFFAITLVSARDALACMCFSTPDAPDEFERAEHVLIAKVISVNKSVEDEKDSEKTFVYGTGTTIMVVGNVYKGGLKPGETIKFPQSAANTCGPIFEEEDIGQEYILYLGVLQESPPLYGFWGAGCGRSGKLKLAEDRLYLDKLPGVRGKTRISGQIITNGITENPVSVGLKVLIRQDGKVWETFVDSNGIYEIYDLPAGEYEVEPELPDGWKFVGLPITLQSVTLKENGHASRDIWLIWWDHD